MLPRGTAYMLAEHVPMFSSRTEFSKTLQQLPGRWILALVRHAGRDYIAEGFCECLTQFNTELVKRIDTPDHTFDIYLVLVECNELPE